MKKLLACMSFLLITFLLFTSCSLTVKKVADDADTNQASPVASKAADAESQKPDEETPKPAETTQEPATATPEPADSGLTLEGIKKAAQAAGYETGEIQYMDSGVDPEPVDGFNVVYKDENSQSDHPILEFASAADAQRYAEQVNAEGYNLCIINGKFLSMVGSSYGVVTNDNEKAALEGLLQSKVMEYSEPAYVPVNYSKDFAGAAARANAIFAALDKLVNRSVLLYDKTLKSDDPNSFAFVAFSMYLSGDLSFVATLGEDQAQIDAVVQVWEMFGATDVKVNHDTPNTYVMTGKRAGLDTTFEISCSYSPEKDSLRLTDKDGDEIYELFEIVPLGGDKYAIQTLYARGIVEYKDGKVGSLVYSLRTIDKAGAYNIDSDSIYPDGNGVDESWVSKDGQDSYDQFISFDGSKLDVAANSFMGDRIKAQISVK